MSRRPHDDAHRWNPHDDARTPNLERGYPRGSALYGHVDYVDYAERVSLGITVEGNRLLNKKDYR